MPPKKTAADSAAPPQPTSSTSPAEQTDGKEKADGAAQRKPSAHPSTAIMVQEALKALDSRKGVTSQAIQSFIKQKYSSVDAVRLKHLVRRALKKGLETGTLVRPASSSVTTGAQGRFRLAPKVKEPRPKGENVDPNLPKAAKDGVKQPQKAGAAKKKTPATGEIKSTENVKPPKKSKKDEEAASSKVAPAKKPKAKKAETKGNGHTASTKATKITKGDGDGRSASAKGPKTEKTSERKTRAAKQTE